MTQYHVTTKHGTRCKNKPYSARAKYCHVHSTNSKRKLLKQNVSFADAQQKFGSIPKLTQQQNISRKASEKNIYSQPNQYWLQYLTKHGDVLAINTPDEFGVFNVLKTGVTNQIEEINNSKKLTAELKSNVQLL